MGRALVTGGAGFIGSHTVDALLADGYDVRVLDNLQPPVHRGGKPAYLAPEAEFLYGDVRNRDDMRRALRDVDVVFHFAAYQDYLTDFSTFFHTNAVGTALLYELIVEHRLPIAKLVIASSQFVQGEGLYRRPDASLVAPPMRSRRQLEAGLWNICERDVPLDWEWTPETHADPGNAYSLSKYAEESMAICFGRRYDIPTVVLRYSIVQGSRQSFLNAYSGVCRIFSSSYFRGRAPTIYEDGLQCRDFVNVHDVVDANLVVLHDPRADYDVFSVGGGRPYTVLAFDRVVARAFEKEGLQPHIPSEFRFGDTRHACSDISKLKALGWTPRRTVDDSVAEYRDFLVSCAELDDVVDKAAHEMRRRAVIGKAQA